MRVDDLKVPLILQKGRFLLILIFKHIFKSSDNLPRNGNIITKFFFSTVNVTGSSVSLLLRKLLMQLSINLIGNAFFFNVFFFSFLFSNNAKVNNINIKKF